MILVKLEGREAFQAAFFFGFSFNLFSIYWIAMVTPPGMIAAVFLVSLYYASALLIFNKVYHINRFAGFLSLPFVWVGMENFRSLTQFAFPWSDLGYSQSYYLYIAQIVSVISVSGLSFLIVTVNLLLYQVFRKELSIEKKLTSIFSSAAIILGLTAYGWVTMPVIPIEGTIKIGMLQGAVPIDVKWDKQSRQFSLDLYDSLTQSIADTGIALFVWPETSAPCYLSNDTWCADQVREIVKKSNSYHLVGALGAEFTGPNEYKSYNSSYQYSPLGRLESRYDKVKLVPFAEQVPYQEQLWFLRAAALKKVLTFIETYDVTWWSDFYPGDSAQLFELPDYFYGLLLCFESTFPDYSRQYVLDGAEFLVGITNDTWFGESVGIYMHSRIFLMRCIENRIWGVRVANSGISYITDGYGRIREQLPVGEVSARVGKVGEFKGYSAFTRIGNLTGKLSWLITLALATIFFFRWLLAKLFLRKP